jgi:hypothetical protein
MEDNMQIYPTYYKGMDNKFDIKTERLSEEISVLTVYTVCPQSPFGALKNCGAQTN